jgi:plasmid stability protein
VRTTLTLDDDVAAKLKSRARRTARSFRDVVNEALRLGLAGVSNRPAPAPFVVQARDLGPLKPGVSLDNIGDLLEHVEGPQHR